MDRASSGNSAWTNVPDDRFSNLISKPDHYEIKGSLTACTNGELSRELRVEGGTKPPSFLQRGYRAITRTQGQSDAYRNGIENVRELLLQKYDQNAVARFDNHFAYRRWAGKPLTVRAFKVFIAKEEELRQGSVNISTEKSAVRNLEGLKEKLSMDKKEWRVIGGSKVPSAAKTAYSFPILPIKRSWFEFSADAEDLKTGREAGISEAKTAILNLIPNETTKKHVDHLFDCHFAEKIKSKEPLTVKELSSFIDAAIKIRNSENGMLGGLYSAVRTANDNGQDAGQAVYNFFKTAYHDLGLAAGAAVVLDQERNANDPIMGLIKGVAAGTLVASESDTERILTAAAERFIAASTAAAPQTSWTSWLLKCATFGIY
ncbi:MAG: hypothetical protein FJ390_01245 [Verrucomicrobia bacterium]|nr:hypothetical protein [Verrucomicrobiota bacterium]